MRKLLLLYLLTSPFITWAQNHSENDTITQLDEVILLETLKTRNAVGLEPSSVISAKVFQNYSPVDMVASIYQIPGVHIFSGALNTNRITIRGMGSRTAFGTDKLKLYYNDIPVTDGSGFSTIEAFDLENLSQIEVVKGPKATAFGTHLGGAIILSPKEALGKSTNLSNNLTVGSFALVKNNLSFNHYDGKWRLGLQYGHLTTDGYRENSQFDRDGILLNTSYQIDAKNSISLLVNHIDYTAHIASSIGETAFAENPKQAAANWGGVSGFETNDYSLAGLSYTHNFSPSLKNTTSVFYSYLDHFEQRPSPLGFLDEYTKGYGLRTRFEGSFGLMGKTTEYTLGGELYKDEYNWHLFETLDEPVDGSLQGEKYADNKEFRSQMNLFASFLFPFTDDFKAQVGLNINKTEYDFRDRFNTGTENKSAQRAFETIFLPSLNLQYKPTETLALFANISRGFSNPTVEQTLTPEGVINPNIAQETGTNYEIGTDLYLHDRRFHLNLAAYQMDVRNLLVAERIAEDQYIGRNAGKTRHRGLEITMDYLWEISPKVQFSPFLTYTLNDHTFVDFVDGEEDYSGNPLTGVPKQERTAGIQLRLFNDFYWNTTHRHVSEIPLRDDNSLDSEPYTVFTTRFGYHKKLSSKVSIGTDLGIDNLFDEVYASSVLINAGSFGGEPRYYYPGNPRNFYASIRLGYRL
ncbi:TonB-dependent receptor family protein [Pseudozobellia thermophila]|uniref:Iron complex outermembrane recepter protein n=1 Tax=Pseudozobellia thermophila TaxID=192903 RepID=A0A1M6ASU5_9FLAO|nr:TonB-dependent receptor [Pseudozobellia thermophila]SHI39303.1 iron complex outermembrane recepter protein [Pseudozobellia thermophila]